MAVIEPTIHKFEKRSKRCKMCKDYFDCLDKNELYRGKERRTIFISIRMGEREEVQKYEFHKKKDVLKWIKRVGCQCKNPNHKIIEACKDSRCIAWKYCHERDKILKNHNS